MMCTKILKSLIHFFILLNIIGCVLLSGCTDNTNNDGSQKQIVIEDYITRLDDLPEGYGILTVDRNLSSQIGFTQLVPAEEILGITFAHENISDINSSYPYISVTVARFISHRNAKDAFSDSASTMQQTVEQFFNTTEPTSELTFDNADASIGYYYYGPLTEEYQYQNASWAYLYVRINKTDFYIGLHRVNPQPEYQYKQMVEDLMTIMIDRYKELQ
jgi:hypothetical protein